MPDLVELSVRGPGGTRKTALVVKVVEQGDTLNLCGRTRCPHWGGQAGLQFVPNDFRCLLLDYVPLPGMLPPKLCQPFYLEAAEDLHAARQAAATRLEFDQVGFQRDLLERLDQAEAFERRVEQLVQEIGL